MQHKFSNSDQQPPLNTALFESEAWHSMKTYMDWLAKLHLSIENNDKQIIQLISALKLTEIPVLLQLYSAVDANEIKFLKDKITAISELRSLNDSLRKQIIFITQALSIYSNINSLPILTRLSLEILQHQNQLLIIAQQFCDVLLLRKNKKFPLALIKVVELTQHIESFYKQENGFHAELAKHMLANSYIQKAKIHRALAGTDLDTLDLHQLQLSQKSYELALALTNDHNIMTCLGFLLNDLSDCVSASQREKILQQAYEYHEKAKLLDINSPDINHGIALDFYKLLKLEKEASQPFDSKKIGVALDAFLITERHNPNARLYHDRGLLYQLVGNEQQALFEFRQGLMLDPNHLLLHYARGLLYFKRNELLPALQDFHLGYMLSDGDTVIKKKFAIEIDHTKRKFLATTKESVLEPDSNSTATSKKMTAFNSDIRKIALEAEYRNTLRRLSTYADSKKPIKVFLSYAWGNLEHERLIERIADELNQAGLYILYDKREDRKGKHLIEFIDKIISEADLIIVVGSKLYLKKYYYRTTNSDDFDHVVATEGAIASYRVLSNRINSDKVIPVMLEGPAIEAFPPVLLPKLAVNLWERDWYIEMLSLIASLYHIPYGDSKFVEITQQFYNVSKEITHAKMRDLAKKYHAPLHTTVSQLTFFQNSNNMHLVPSFTQPIQSKAKL